jgi:hypothetical protein
MQLAISARAAAAAKNLADVRDDGHESFVAHGEVSCLQTMHLSIEKCVVNRLKMSGFGGRRLPIIIFAILKTDRCFSQVCR